MVSDAQLALDLRDAGIASLQRHPWLEDAREWAMKLCRAGLSGTVTSDDVHRLVPAPPHENCWGAMFKDKRFKSTGTHVQSKRPSAHGRWIQVWELKEA